MTLPRPADWRERSSGATFFLLLIALSALAGAVWGVIQLGRGDHITAAVVGGYSVALFCLAVATVRVAVGKVRPRATFDVRGTTLHLDQTFTVLCGLAAAMLIPSGLLFFVGLLTDTLHLPLATAASVIVGGAVVAALVGAVMVLAAMFKHGGLAKVRLSPSGFEISELRRSTNGRWADVRDVGDEVADKRAREPIALKMADESTHVINVAANFTPRGTALYWMVRHFWRHPEDRTELTDARAQQRLSDERFDTS